MNPAEYSSMASIDPTPFSAMHMDGFKSEHMNPGPSSSSHPHLFSHQRQHDWQQQEAGPSGHHGHPTNPSKFEKLECLVQYFINFVILQENEEAASMRSWNGCSEKMRLSWFHFRAIQTKEAMYTRALF
jgi:hypothetical protein